MINMLKFEELMNPSKADVPNLSYTAVGTSRAIAKLYQLIAAGGTLDGRLFMINSLHHHNYSFI